MSGGHCKHLPTVAEIVITSQMKLRLQKFPNESTNPRIHAARHAQRIGERGFEVYLHVDYVLA